jgi:serine/threonine-protein kinase
MSAAMETIPLGQPKDNSVQRLLSAVTGTDGSDSDPGGRTSVAGDLAGGFQPVQRYDSAGEIARGGMGRVLLVHDVDIERDVAMKSLHPHLAESSTHLAQFVREARMIGCLEHPNIVPLYDMGMGTSGEPYFTMKYVDGRSLAEIIELLQTGDADAHAEFTWARRCQILQQICDAVGFAHSRGIAHRDLKPANVMIGNFGETVVADWGLAGPMTRIALSSDDKSIEGTPSYLSPEVIAGDPASDTLRDIYAIGVIVYELFGLAQPFRGDSVREVLRSAVVDDPVPLYDVTQPGQSAVPVEIYHIAKKAMHRNPDERYETCDELNRHLQLYLDGKFPIRCPSTALKRWTLELAHLIDAHPKAAVLTTATVFLGLLALLILT